MTQRTWWLVTSTIALALVWRCGNSRIVPHEPTAPARTPPQVQHAQAAPQFAPIEPGALRLEGQIVDDDDQPIGGARITLAGARVTTSEADGSFAFDGLAAGTYALAAEQGDRYGEELTAHLDDSSDPITVKLVRGPLLVVHVVAPSQAPIAGAKVEASARTAFTDEHGIARLRAVGMESETLDVSAAGRERVRDSVVTGDDPTATVEATIALGSAAPVAGSVVDEAGQPVAGAYVEVESLDRKRHDTMTAEADGTWRFTELGRGRYVARASSNDHTATAEIKFELDGVHERAGVVLRVDAGGEIAGTAVDEAGKPVSGATVAVGVKTIAADGAGRFAVRGLDPDDYPVSAYTERAGSPSETVKLARHGRAEVRLVLHASGIAGIVVDPHGHPIEGARVFASSPDPHGTGYAQSDEHGRFDLGGLPPGTYELTAHREDEQGPTVDTALKIATGTRNVRIVLEEQASVVGRVILAGKPVPYFGVAIIADASSASYEHPQPVRDPSGAFTLKNLVPGRRALLVVGPGFARRVIEQVDVRAGKTDLGDIVVEAGASVHGFVLDEHGSAVAGARVEICEGLPGGRDEHLRALLGDTYSALTDAHGEYRIAGITIGEHARRITATHAHYGSSPFRALAADETEVDLVLNAVGAIDGSIANFDPALRFRSVTAVLDGNDDARYRVQLESDGAFQLTALPPGRYELTLSGHRLPPLHVNVVANQHTPAAFALPSQPATLVVHAAACDVLSLRLPSETSPFRYEVCSDGEATFDELAPGTYDVCRDSDTCKTVVVTAPTATLTL